MDLFYAEENETGDEGLYRYGILPCRNCRCLDFVEDFARGDSICCGCGCVADVIVMDARPEYDGSTGFDVEIPPVRPQIPGVDRYAFQKIHKSKSADYKRITYAGEKLSQWRELEPDIPPHDSRRIADKWEQLAPIEWPNDYKTVCGKDRIRVVLAALDKELRQHRADASVRFIRCYLEKWLTIRHRLIGQRSTGTYADDSLVDILKCQFSEIQGPFDKFIRERCGRHSLLNYNFIFRRLLDLNGCSWMAEDFPPLKTTTKQKRLIEMWREICKHLKWPYVNSDERIFPDMKFYSE